jgi:hypothetical protein
MTQATTRDGNGNDNPVAGGNSAAAARYLQDRTEERNSTVI